MDATQQAAVQGAIQGAVTAAETVAPVAIGVAAIADPRVGAAVQAATLSLQLMNTATQLQQMGQLTDAELMKLWVSRGAAMAKAHDEIFGADPSVDNDPNVKANEVATAAQSTTDGAPVVEQTAPAA
jgi:hypothetical protein